MQGSIYISQIREDLTFEVYNLFPDYVFPGKIRRVDIRVEGAPEAHKRHRAACVGQDAEGATQATSVSSDARSGTSACTESGRRVDARRRGLRQIFYIKCRRLGAASTAGGGAGHGPVQQSRPSGVVDQDPANFEAAELVGRLHDALADAGRDARHDLMIIAVSTVTGDRACRNSAFELSTSRPERVDISKEPNHEAS